MTGTYTAIYIIYNPISTGPSKTLAEELRNALKGTVYESVTKIVTTQYEGHAEVLAYELAQASKRPLIISSSGDGSYSEVINGALQAIDEGYDPVCGLLPAGNANDHYENLHQQPLDQQILHGTPALIDVLNIETRRTGKPWQRYAHSYIGIGLTPKAGHALNQVRLNPLKETWIVMKTLARLRPTHILVDGIKCAYDSLVFSNVARMSKVLQLSDDAVASDGKFEIIALRTRNKFTLLRSLLKATTVGLEEAQQASTYQFRTLRSIPVQVDGEVFRIDGDTKVSITVRRRALPCLI